MRKLALAFTAAVLISLAFLSLRRPAEVSETPPAPDATPVTRIAHVVARPKEAVRPKKMSGAFRPRPAGATPEGNVIAFQVHDGMAIAYGDVILGEPDDPQLTEGFYDSPAPTLWDRPEIPYAIADGFPAPERVKQAIEYFNHHTPVQFIPYDGQQPDAVVFETGNDNCYSLLGKQGGLQPIKLARGCDWIAIAHELMHVLGFVHEQSRPDRDRYLEILTGNIEDKFRDQFAIVPETLMEASRQGPFDYHSIMLYGPTMFAKSGQVTMRSRTSDAIQPATDGLSPGDIEKLRELYRPYVK